MFPRCDLGGFLFPLLLDWPMLSFVFAACLYRHDLLWSSQTCTALSRALRLFRRSRLSVGRQLERCVRYAGLCRRQSDESIFSAMCDRCFHWLAIRGVAVSSCEAGMYSREYANGTLISAYSFSKCWMDSPITFLVLIEFEQMIVRLLPVVLARLQRWTHREIGRLGLHKLLFS